MNAEVPRLSRLAVIGLGLIGGSFAKGLREQAICKEVIGFDLDARSRTLAVELGVVDRCTDTLADACRGADVILLAVPILAMERLLAELAAFDLQCLRMLAVPRATSCAVPARCLVTCRHVLSRGIR